MGGYGPAIVAVAVAAVLGGNLWFLLWMRRRAIQDAVDRINADLAKAQAEDAQRKAEVSDELRKIAESGVGGGDPGLRRLLAKDPEPHQ